MASKTLKSGKLLATAQTDELVFCRYRSYPAGYWVTLNSVGVTPQARALSAWATNPPHLLALVAHTKNFSSIQPARLALITDSHKCKHY